MSHAATTVLPKAVVAAVNKTPVLDMHTHLYEPRFKSLLLFCVLILLRYLAIELSFHSLAYTIKEKLFMSLNIQKGIAVAAITFTLGTLLLNQTTLVDAGDLTMILELILSFLLYSIILSTIVSRTSKYFLKEVEA